MNKTHPVIGDLIKWICEEKLKWALEEVIQIPQLLYL